MRARRRIPFAIGSYGNRAQRACGRQIRFAGICRSVACGLQPGGHGLRLCRSAVPRGWNILGQYAARPVFCVRFDRVSRYLNGLVGKAWHTSASVRLHPDAARHAGSGDDADRRFLDCCSLARLRNRASRSCCLLDSARTTGAVPAPTINGPADVTVRNIPYLTYYLGHDYFNHGEQQQPGGPRMWLTHANLPFNRLAERLVHIVPQFSRGAGICDVPTDTSGALSATEKKSSLEWNIKGIAADGTVLSLISFALVAIAIIVALFGTGLSSLIPPRQATPGATIEKHETKLAPDKQTVPQLQAISIPPKPTVPPHGVTSASSQPTSAAKEARPTLSKPFVAQPRATPSLPEQTRLDLDFSAWWGQHMNGAKSIWPRTYAPSEATLTPPPEPSALSQPVPSNSPVVPAPASVPANTIHDQHRDAHMRFLQAQQARVEAQLMRPSLSAAERRRLERRKAYWGRAMQRTLNAP